MSVAALISELQWTAVFAANLLGTWPEWGLRSLGAALGGAWIGASSLRAWPGLGSWRRVLVIVLTLLTLLLLVVLLGGYGAARLVIDHELAAQQGALVVNALLLMLEGAGLAALTLVLGGSLSRRPRTLS